MFIKTIDDILIETPEIDNPQLSKYLTLLAHEIKINYDFYPDTIGFNKEYSKCTPFLQYFFDRAKNKPSHSITILKGDAGMGKSSFIEWWIFKNNLNKYSSRININSYDYNKNPSIIEYIYSKCILNFRPLLTDPKISREFGNKVIQLAQILGIKGKITFRQGFISQSKEFQRKFPDFGLPILLCALICSVNKAYNKPVWIFMDNVDLQAKKIQEDFIHGTFSIYDEIFNIAEKYEWKYLFHFVLTLRLETDMRWRGFTKEYSETPYPTANVFFIAYKKIQGAINKLSQKYNNQESLGIFPFTIDKLNESILKNIKEPQLNNLDFNWCMCLVHNNIRRFLNAFATIISSKNFVDYILNPSLNLSNLSKSNIDPYLRFFIKGRFNYFPGNNYINEASPESPLFFNLFGTEYNKGMKTIDYRKNYLIYIRILQYLNYNRDAHNNTLSYATLKKDLSHFFDIEIINNSIKTLLWSRLIDEVELGIRDIFDGHTFEEIELEKLNDIPVLAFTKTSSLYITHLLCEYEYLSAMSFVSYYYKIENYKYENTEKTLQIAYANSTFLFLESWYTIIINNISNYIKFKKFDKYIEFFKFPNDIINSWGTAIRNAIIKIDNLNKTSSLDMNIEKISNKLLTLERKGLSEINNKFN